MSASSPSPDARQDLARLGRRLPRPAAPKASRSDERSMILMSWFRTCVWTRWSRAGPGRRGPLQGTGRPSSPCPRRVHHRFTFLRSRIADHPPQDTDGDDDPPAAAWTVIEGPAGKELGRRELLYTTIDPTRRASSRRQTLPRSSTHRRRFESPRSLAVRARSSPAGSPRCTTARWTGRTSRSRR